MLMAELFPKLSTNLTKKKEQKKEKKENELTEAEENSERKPHTLVATLAHLDGDELFHHESDCRNKRN